jgi:uncharacterized protein (TIGR02246 family)
MAFRMFWLPLLLAFVSASVSPAGPGMRPTLAQEASKAAAPAAAEAAPSAEEKAILALDEAFVRAYNKGDARALAALFAEDAEVEEDDGLRFRGREEIAKALAEGLEADKGATISFDVESIRFLTPDSAKEVGRSVVKPAEGPAVSRLYTVLYVRRDGRWQIADVREEPDPVVSPHDRLEGLSWLIGDWLDEGDDALVRVNARWSDDGNFLLRTFTVNLRGRPSLSISQRIGWDPLAKQIRSWEFDSAGGYGEGRWTNDGDRWIVKHTAVRPEGSTATATNVMTRERPDLIRWISTDRIVDGRSEPDGTTYTLVKAPAPPVASPASDTTNNPTPDAVGRPK